MILGLRIDGNVITGSTHAEGVEGGWRDLIRNMFGTSPDPVKSRSMVGARLKLSWLDSVVPKVLADDADERELVRYTQAYLQQSLGGVLFTDHQGSQVHCMFIPLLQNLDHCATLSWGSGVLAYLYRELCKSCKIGVEEMAGCVLLVQLWAWTRLPTLAPVPSKSPLDVWGDIAGPYGFRWCVPKSFADVTSHVTWMMQHEQPIQKQQPLKQPVQDEQPPPPHEYDTDN
ncbi:serine/threonine-protein phosphatase 7 long form homolog [Apium graveolens]|uniref:serine/threonine-protein phosphatase 7 long form homolog n=1 Tax=Apium graveolens TaxID=4045 RepID=UPI003D7B32D0